MLLKWVSLNLQIGIDTPEKLRIVIQAVFEKAVAEPTFCSLYAQLCEKLSQALPGFHVTDENKPVTFRAVLLDTCQDEFEGTSKAKQNLETITVRVYLYE